MRNIFFSAILLLTFFSAFSQDTLVLINGKTIIAKSITLEDYTIAYRKMEEDAKLKRIDPERVFSIKYRDGSERIVYIPDSLDPIDFKVEEMRMFIRGEQDASKYYKNNVNKVVGFSVGAGSSMLGIFGLAAAPLYSTVVGSFSPNIEKQQVSDPALRSNMAYREGYEKKVRDRKIRNSLISGLIGFAAGSIVFGLTLADSD